MSDFLKFCVEKGITYDVDPGGPENESFPNSDVWTVLLRYKGRRLTVPFYTGYGWTKSPDAADVLSCLLSDAQGVEDAGSFETWCADLGYDTDSRKAEKTFKACERISKKLNRFLGDDFEAFAEAARDY